MPELMKTVAGQARVDGDEQRKTKRERGNAELEGRAPGDTEGAGAEGPASARPKRAPAGAAATRVAGAEAGRRSLPGFGRCAPLFRRGCARDGPAFTKRRSRSGNPWTRDVSPLSFSADSWATRIAPLAFGRRSSTSCRVAWPRRGDPGPDRRSCFEGGDAQCRH